MSRLYQVQSIRGHKEVGGKTQYLIHWKKYGDSHDSWEPADNLKGCEKVIDEYEMKLKRQATPKRRTRAKAVTPSRRSSRLIAMQISAATEVKGTPEDSDIESDDKGTIDKNVNIDSKPKRVPAEKKEKQAQQIKRRSQPNLIVAGKTSKEDTEQKAVIKRNSYSSLVATGDLTDNSLNNAQQMLKSYELRNRQVQPMEEPSHPIPSTSILSSDEETEILSRRPVRKGRSPHRKIGVAPDPVEDNEKPQSLVRTSAKYKVSVQEGNLLVRKFEQEAKEPIEAATFEEDKEVKPTEPVISDVEEEEITTPSQEVVSPTTTQAYPNWMHLNCAEFLLALLLTALLTIMYWCWNSDVC